MGNKMVANHIKKSKLVKDMVANSKHVLGGTHLEGISPATACQIAAVTKLRDGSG